MDDGGSLGSQNQTPRAGGARQSWPIAHVEEGNFLKPSAALGLDPLMGKARGVNPEENSEAGVVKAAWG